jgi:hypothetical protein
VPNGEVGVLVAEKGETGRVGPEEETRLGSLRRGTDLVPPPWNTEEEDLSGYVITQEVGTIGCKDKLSSGANLPQKALDLSRPEGK